MARSLRQATPGRKRFPEIRSGENVEGANSRSSILNAATDEFARVGLAGARIQSIAQEAGVNVALLYYYFETKEKLYAAVLEQVFSNWARRVAPALEQDGGPREKVMAYVEAYFDFIAESPHRPRLVQQEMMQLGNSGFGNLQVMARRHVRPIHQALLELLREGYKKGEFRKVSPDFVYSISGIIIGYFTSSTFIHAVSGHDPLTPARVAERRQAVLDTIATALLRPDPPKIRKRKEEGNQ